MSQSFTPIEDLVLTDVNELKGIDPLPEAVAFTRGNESIGDGESNLYFWDPSLDPSNADGTTKIASNVESSGSWRRMFTPSTELDTSNVQEDSTNLYFTDKRAQNAVGSITQGGTQINTNYDSVNDSLTISHENTGSDNSSSNTLPTVLKGISMDQNGHVGSISTGTFSGGTAVTLSGGTINHGNTGDSSSSGNSGGKVLQNLSTDNLGHVEVIEAKTLTSDDINEGSSNLFFSESRALAALETASSVSASGSWTFGSDVDLNANLSIENNLVVENTGQGIFKNKLGVNTTPDLTSSPLQISGNVDIADGGAIRFLDSNNNPSNLIYQDPVDDHRLKLWNDHHAVTTVEIEATQPNIQDAYNESRFEIKRSSDNSCESLNLVSRFDPTSANKTAKSHAIRIEKCGDGKYRSFFFDWHNGSTVVDGMEAIPPNESDGPAFVYQQDLILDASNASFKFKGGNPVSSIATSVGSSGDDQTLVTESATRTAIQNAITGDILGGTDVTVSSNSGTTTISHENTGSDSSTSNSGGTLIQNIEADSNGHVNSVSTKTLDSDDISEGNDNEYFTDSRVFSAIETQITSGSRIQLTEDTTNENLEINISGNSSLTIESDGTNITNDAALLNFGSSINISQPVSDELNLTLDPSVVNENEAATFSKSVTVQGDLTVEGSEFINDTQQIASSTNTIFVNKGESGAGISAGFSSYEIDRGSLPPYAITFDESDDEFKIGIRYYVINYSNLTGSFAFNEEVVGQTSNISAHIFEDTGSSLKLKTTSGSFQNGETIKGSSSSATATVDSVTLTDDTLPTLLRGKDPLDNGIIYYDSNTKKAQTSTSLTFDGSQVSASTIKINNDLNLSSGTSVSEITKTIGSTGDDSTLVTEASVRTAIENTSVTSITGGTDINSSRSSGNVTIDHANTGSDSSTGNSGGTVLQNIDTDSNGHIDSVNNVSLTTDEISEGSTNLYFTNARAVTAIENAGSLNFGCDLNLMGCVIVSQDLDVDGVFTLSSGTDVSNIKTIISGDSDNALATEGAIKSFVNSKKRLDIVSKGSNFTLSNTDNNTAFKISASITITLPAGLDQGLNVIFINSGGGTVTFVAGSGATLNSPFDQDTLEIQNAQASLVCDGNDNYYIGGQLGS